MNRSTTELPIDQNDKALQVPTPTQYEQIAFTSAATTSDTAYAGMTCRFKCDQDCYIRLDGTDAAAYSTGKESNIKLSSSDSPQWFHVKGGISVIRDSADGTLEVIVSGA